MVRTVEFLENGDIVITGKTSRDVVQSGVVLLTRAEAETALTHGWRIEGEPETATVPPLYWVKR